MYRSLSSQAMPRTGDDQSPGARAVRLASIGDAGAPVLAPCCFVVVRSRGLFLAEVYPFHQRLLDAEQLHRGLDGLCAALAQGKVVFAAAAHVGVALHGDAGRRALQRLGEEGLSPGLPPRRPLDKPRSERADALMPVSRRVDPLR